MSQSYWYLVEFEVYNDAAVSNAFSGFIEVLQTSPQDTAGDIQSFHDLSQIDTTTNTYLNVLLKDGLATEDHKFNASVLQFTSSGVNIDVSTNLHFNDLRTKRSSDLGTKVGIVLDSTPPGNSGFNYYSPYENLPNNSDKFNEINIYYETATLTPPPSSEHRLTFFENDPNFNFSQPYNVYSESDALNYPYLALSNYKYYYKVVITQISGPLYPPPLPISQICFPAGTPISTDSGEIPIEKINAATHTIDNKKIVGITKTITMDQYVVCFEKDALGRNIPSRNTIISENHRVFYNNELIKAKKFIDNFKKVYKIPYNGDILYNVLLEEHGKMVVNNLVCETLDPENRLAQMFLFVKNLTIDQQHHILKNYNDVVLKSAVSESKKKFNYFSNRR